MALKKANQIGLANPPLAFKEKERPTIEVKLQQIRASRLPHKVVTPKVLKGQVLTIEQATSQTVKSAHHNPFIHTGADMPNWLNKEGE